jgi:uncharacterized protein (TIGR00297 family)
MRPDPLVSLLLAALLAGGGWFAQALTGLGATAACLVGVAILSGAGWPGAAVLGAFFFLSSALGRLPGGAPPVSGDPKGERRDVWQVIANGGFAALGAVLALGDPARALWIVTAALAAAGADTWATSIGARSRTAPRLLLLGPEVPAGTNGGMTLLGSGGAILGAAVISGTGAFTGAAPRLLLWGTVIGVAGMTLDSILGTVLQGRFHCPVCHVDTERRVHRCGRRTTLTGGMAWLTNDGVNALTTAAAALAGGLAWRCGTAA